MLDPEQIQKLRGMLAHPGYTDVYKPILINRGKDFIQMLAREKSERRAPYDTMDDNVLRGLYRDVEWNLMVWDEEIRIYEHNRRMEAQQRNGEPVDVGGEPAGGV